MSSGKTKDVNYLLVRIFYLPEYLKQSYNLIYYLRILIYIIDTLRL